MLHKKSSNNNLMIKALATSVMTAAIVIPIATENVQAAAPVSKTTFKDVPKSHWAYKSIKQVAEKGLVTGYEDGTYKPSAQVTRAEFATFLARVFESNERATVSFNDVSDTHWANEAIQEGLAVGFIQTSDYANNKFEPNKPMTRGEMSRWLANGLAHANADYGKAIEEMANSSLTLIPIPEFYGGGVNKKDLPYIGVALGTGLLSGYEDFTFKPNGNTTRAEVATILIRFMDVMKKTPSNFTGLKELREVAGTGTNILTISNFKKTKYTGYEGVLGKTHTHMNKGVATIERAIVVDTTGSKAQGIYKDMFFNGGAEPYKLNKDVYLVFHEYTLAPIRDVSLNGIADGALEGYSSTFIIDKDKIDQFKIPTPENIFKKGEKYRYWVSNLINNSSGTIIKGRTDDNSLYYYEIPQ
ncbi:S-layer homology domain-containing protein [Lysinibacillus fusiformis]|uniref:S-layer homology domain-containing protein n=1 Tax=Lysinibacillus fusiformis TaxID=28031 RepID=UPI0008857236|nr:S-layer homology domain-containing protein [Lysinibacillus fusiformis]SCX42027.1 S-layer homology domain-containing protein [Lysinibacillus fusiformis]SDB11461.1 S-layer homology domain-containing protein [Lysinibacillus fusiformis]SFH89126.1 S-layer homology domain-containing protein [Lysinibacillus fusiformis]SFS34512.1 S-layer homology domain-containing protein [Lysinibacillus fusiformis]